MAADRVPVEASPALTTALAVLAVFGWRELTGEPLPGEVAAALGALIAPIVLEIRAVRQALARRAMRAIERDLAAGGGDG